MPTQDGSLKLRQERLVILRNCFRMNGNLAIIRKGRKTLDRVFAKQSALARDLDLEESAWERILNLTVTLVKYFRRMSEFRIAISSR